MQRRAGGKPDDEVHPRLEHDPIAGYWDSDALADYGVTCPILRKPFTSEALRDAMAAALGAGRG